MQIRKNLFNETLILSLPSIIPAKLHNEDELMGESMMIPEEDHIKLPFFLMPAKLYTDQFSAKK